MTPCKAGAWLRKPTHFVAVILFLSVASAASPSLLAQSVGSEAVPASALVRQSDPPPRLLAKTSGVAPFAILRPAVEGAVDQLEAVREWNGAGRLPIRIGFVRPLPGVGVVRFGPEVAELRFAPLGGGVMETDATRLVWGAELRVELARRLRAHLGELELPEGARIWVYGDDGETVGPFGLELASEDGLWTPSVAGPSLRLEVELPLAAVRSGKGFGFTVDRVGEIVSLDEKGAPTRGAKAGECLEDVTCFNNSTGFPALADAEKAVAQLSWVEGIFLFACTGTLLNDTDGSTFIPYLLTANHCIDSQAVASTLQARFDVKTTSCGGSTPPLGTLPVVNGATLLATGAATDFTLLRLLTVPAGARTLLGWNANASAVTLAARLSSVSHPVPEDDVFPQTLAQGHKASTPNNCTADGITQPSFIQMVEDVRGGTFGGSSGAALLLDSGQVVGQLLGACGPNPDDGCDLDNDDVWGAFSVTFPSVAGFLSPTVGGDPPPPFGSFMTTAALPGYEFQVRINGASSGNKESDCVGETLCVSGALPGRSEVFLRIVGPKPNGFLQVNIIKFSTSRIEVWVRRASQVNYYDLAAVAPDSDSLAGLVDKEAFLP
jgi:hypothetical protein